MSRARWRLRHTGLALSLVALVILPTALATAYLYLRAEDQYASTLAFTVRSEDMPTAADIIGGLGSVFGGASGASRDADILYEFIGSQEIVARIDARLDLGVIYARHHRTDPLFSYAPEGRIEDLTRYWRRMLWISYDSSSGLMELRALAFSPEDARRIAEEVRDESSRMINELTAIARADALRYSAEDLERAQDQLRSAREDLTLFRLRHRLVDLTADIQGQMGVLNTLQVQLATALIDFDLLGATARAGDPRLEQAQNRIEVIRQRIDAERQEFSGSGGASYATIAGEFERLTVEREFAEARYLAAQSAYEAAQTEANRQSRYLATYIRPTLAQTSEYPQRALIASGVLVFLFLIWAILALIFYAMRDRR